MMTIIMGDKENVHVEKKKQQKISYSETRWDGKTETGQKKLYVLGKVNRWMEEQMQERDKNRTSQRRKDVMLP